MSIADGQGTRAFTYNDSLQLAAETNALGLIQRQYDSLGRPAGFTLGSDYAVTYDFSSVGRLETVAASAPSAYTARYTYLANSDLIAGMSNEVVQIMRSYEPNRNLLTSIVNTAGGTPVSRFDYASDELARRTRRVDDSAVTNDFGYNQRSELTTAAMGTNNYGYEYDPIGNRLSASNNAEALSYAANALNQYTNIADGVTLTPTYDLDGNMVTYGDWTFAWDGENRLIGASNGTTVVGCSYDYMGRRYQKVVGNATNVFLYDGWAMVREQSATTTNSYVYGLDLSGSMQGAGTIGGILWENLNGVVAFPAYDGNGNLTDLTDTNGASVAHYEYDPYGNTIAKTGTLADANPFRFSTKYYDVESGLYYYGLRFYNPSLGRWLSRDPIGELAFQVLHRSDHALRSLNANLELPYCFVKNASIDTVDLLGLAFTRKEPHACTAAKVGDRYNQGIGDFLVKGYGGSILARVNASVVPGKITFEWRETTEAERVTRAEKALKGLEKMPLGGPKSPYKILQGAAKRAALGGAQLAIKKEREGKDDAGDLVLQYKCSTCSCHTLIPLVLRSYKWDVDKDYREFPCERSTDGGNWWMIDELSPESGSADVYSDCMKDLAAANPCANK